MDETTNTNEVNEQILQMLETLNGNLVDNTDSIKDLQEYLIIQDQKQKEKEKQEAEEKSVTDKQQQEQEQLVKAEESASADAQAETYEMMLVDIRLEQQLTNQLISGSFIFYGIIAGILLFKILWDKLK